MVKKEIQKLMSCFPGSFINHNFEVILLPKTNLYFLLNNVKTVEDLQFKVIAWCSRDASKTQPYYSDWRNKEYQTRVRNSINEFLGTDFNADQWMDIYTEFGNACHEDRCREFIRSGFDLKILSNKGEN